MLARVLDAFDFAPYGSGVRIPTSSRLQAAEVAWFLLVSGFAAALFAMNSALLFTEFNVWALDAYITDFIKASSTDKYVIRTLNTPNALFNLLYVYLRDVFFFANSYNVYKAILLACVIANVYIIIRLSSHRSAYIILLPVVFGYVLVGGMTNYYISITLFLLAMLLYEEGTNSFLKLSVISFLAYQAHFMGFFALMFLVLFKEGLRRAILYAIVPFALLISYKLQYVDLYNNNFEYSLLNHFLSVRRVLLPSITDYESNGYILLFSAGLNLAFIIYVAYLIVTKRLIPQNNQAAALFALLVLVYFAVPAILAGSGSNIHERLVIPFFAIFVHMATEAKVKRSLVVTFTILIIANIEACHYFYDLKGHDYRNALLNKEPMGAQLQTANDILNGKPVDAIEGGIFSTGFVKRKD